jgi:hypothetical protein
MRTLFICVQNATIALADHASLVAFLSTVCSVCNIQTGRGFLIGHAGGVRDGGNTEKAKKMGH